MTRDLLSLRPYQREAIDKVTGAWAAGVRRPAVVLPTGMGKTVVFSHMIAEQHASTGRRSVVLVHRDELADQALHKLESVAPHLAIGKVKAREDDVDADVVVASVQTLARSGRLDRILSSRRGAPGLWVTDECHHALAPAYQRIYAATPDALHVGFTATMERSDKIGLGSVWDDVVSSKSIAYAVAHGFLVKPRGRNIPVEGLDLDGLKNSRGDFQEGALGDALESSTALEAAVTAYEKYAAGRTGIAFTPTVATAEHLAAMLNARGIPAAAVSGGTPREQRRAVYAASQAGKIRVICNCMVLTEGFDAPWLSAAIMLRPTKSNPLYVQMVGRVLRPFPGKTDALIIDVVGASDDSKLVSLIDLEDGLWPQAKPCKDCLCLPCECLCPECKLLVKTECTCPKDGQAAVIRVRRSAQESFDLFQSSRSAWNRTAGGVWFIGCGEAGYVFLAPAAGEPGLHDVWVLPFGPHGELLHWRPTQYTGMELDTAMTWAEAEAEDVGASLADRSARWRKKPASDRARGLAGRMGIETSGEMNAGAVSDLIDTYKASRVFDPYLGTGS